MKPNMLLTARWLAAAAVVVAWTAAANAQASRAATTRPTTTQVTTAATSRESIENTPLAGRKARDAWGAVSDWVQPLAALAVVIALLFVLRAILKQLTSRRATARGGAVVQVLHRTHLGGRCEVCLIRLGKRVLLVGLGASGPVTLCEVRDEQEVQELLESLTGAGGRGSGSVREVTAKIRSRLAGEEKAQG